jgi:hypothetical protein
MTIVPTIVFVLIVAGCRKIHVTGGGNSPIAEHPTSRLAKDGETNVTFQIRPNVAVASNATFRWFRNGAPIDSETSKQLRISGADSPILTISKADTNLIGFYQCAVEYDGRNPDARERLVTLSEEAQLTIEHHSLVTVYGTPIGGSGGGVSCPPQYAGYVNYRTAAFPYGWFFPNGGIAVDSNRTDTVVAYFGSPLTNYGCCSPTPTNWVNVPANTCAYRFTIYFRKGRTLPTGPYPITLLPN